MDTKLTKHISESAINSLRADGYDVRPIRGCVRIAEGDTAQISADPGMIHSYFYKGQEIERREEIDANCCRYFVPCEGVYCITIKDAKRYIDGWIVLNA